MESSVLSFTPHRQERSQEFSSGTKEGFGGQKSLSGVQGQSPGSNKYERYYWTRKGSAYLLTLLCHYGKLRQGGLIGSLSSACA